MNLIFEHFLIKNTHKHATLLFDLNKSYLNKSYKSYLNKSSFKTTPVKHWTNKHFQVFATNFHV